MRSVILALAILILPLWARASDAAPDGPLINEKERALLEALRESEETIAALKQTSESRSPQLSPSPVAEGLTSIDETDRILSKLTAQIESLRSRAVVERAASLSLQTPQKVRVRGSKTVYYYKPDSVYEVTVSPDHITDIQLEPGETITGPPTAGDTVRWNIGVMKSGQAPNEITHLILKALDSDIETNLVIATNLRVYQLRLRGSDWHMPSVSWHYPKDQSAAIVAAMKRASDSERTVTPEKLNFDYTIDGDDYPWKPVRVFDDGEKTFVQMPKEMRVNEAPALFLVEDSSEPLLVNCRVKGDYYIVDRLFEHAELRVGPHRRVEIRAGRIRKNFIERLFDWS